MWKKKTPPAKKPAKGRKAALSSPYVPKQKRPQSMARDCNYKEAICRYNKAGVAMEKAENNSEKLHFEAECVSHLLRIRYIKQVVRSNQFALFDPIKSKEK
jgi:hypothetical protein